MWKKMITVLFVLVGVAAFSFAGGTGEENEAGIEDKPQFNLIFSATALPDESIGKAAILFAEEIERTTDGQITVEMYLGDSLVTQSGQFPAVRKGDTDMTFGDPNFFSQYLPYLQMFAAAYIFDGYEHMTNVMNGEIGQQIEEDLAEAAGVRILTTMYMGTRQVNLRDIGRIVQTPDDMSGVKLRMPNTASWLLMGEALGAQPTPMALTEVYLGLQAGAVDGQDNPLPATLARNFQEVTKYIVLTNHFVNPIMPVMNEDTWQMLGPELQEKVLAAWETAREYSDNDTLLEEAGARAEMEAAGMEFIGVEHEVWEDYALDVYLGNEEMTSEWDMDLYARMLEAGE